MEVSQVLANALWAGNEGITEVASSAGGGISTRGALPGIQWDFEIWI